MYSNKQIQVAKFGYLMISILFCVLGILLMLVPNFSLSLLCKAGGGILIMFGLVKIIGYCSKDLYRLAFQYDLAFGILLIALGIVFIFRTEKMVNVLCLLMGMCILADALLKIQVSIDSRAFGISKWWLILGAAIITGAIGFLLIFRPSESAQVLMIMFGMAVFTEGILNMITILTAVKIIRNQKPLVLDGEYRECDKDL